MFHSSPRLSLRTPPRTPLCSSARSSATEERTMSDQDEALLDEDLGDEEYDLGNDEEEALLADDYEIDRQNSYKGEEETDDVLDLGVTDALDDLEGEDENIEYRSDTDNHNHSDFYKEERAANHGAYYDQEEHEDIREERYEDGPIQTDSALQNSLNTVDLREKLQKNVQRKVFVGNGQGLEDDDCDEAEERRNRFQNERIVIPQRMNHEIPDSLENVVTVEQVRQQQPPFRGHGRGRGIGGIRGGRFAVPNPQGNFIPRFTHNMRGQPTFGEQKPFRQPLLEGRPLMYPRVPSSNMMNQQQQLMYQQNPPQLPPYMSNGPPQPSGPHFAEPCPPFNPNQFPDPGMPQGPRMMGGGPRMEYRPRGPMPGPAMPRYNCPPGVPSYMQNQSQHFQPQMIPGSQGPSLLGNPGLQLPGGQAPPRIHGNPGGPPISLNQGPPMQENPGGVMMHNFSRMPGPNHGGPPGPNQPPISSQQQPFNSGPSFQEPAFEGRPMYDPRPMYNNQPPPQPPVSQLNNSATPPRQAGPHVPNVPLPPGHKILINPHFRGAVQSTSDARLTWDSQQQQPQQPSSQHQQPHQPTQHQQSQHPPVSGEGFAQAPASYQTQNPYGQPARPPQQQQQSSQEYQTNYPPVKSDDPYAYFSDVWQENKAQKPPTVNKSYPPDNNYSRDSYNYGSKYGKSDSTWDRDSYQEEQRGSSQSYRERDPPPRPRIEVQRQRVSVSNNTYHEPYNQKPSSRPVAASARPVARLPVKRSPESHDRAQRPLSPKRVKIMSNRHEFRTTSSNESASVKKAEEMDSEMREYRKKMEEQKRLREKILREKENRRKQAAMEKMGDESRVDSRNEGIQQQEMKSASVVTGVTKDNVHPLPTRGRGRPANAQATEGPERAPGVRIVRAVQTVEAQLAKDAVAPIATVQANERARPLTGQPGTRRVVIQKPLPGTQKIATTVQKTVSNLQRAPGNARVAQNVPKGILKKQPAAAGQKVIVNANRTIVQELPLRASAKDPKANVQKLVVNAQSNQRVVLQKPTGQVKPRALDTKTNTVRIENLAASTSESQIRRMCQGIGTLESIHMGEGNATIVFKTQSAALVFHKKYQRKMLDLSLINVQLVQPTSKQLERPSRSE